MTISEMQKAVDQWIKDHGVRYYDVKTNTIILTEELGEFCRIIARTAGEQSFKTPKSPQEIKNDLQEEMADILFVLTCLANQLDVDLQEAFTKNLDKKTKRDHDRHHQNPKLK